MHKFEIKCEYPFKPYSESLYVNCFIQILYYLPFHMYRGGQHGGGGGGGGGGDMSGLISGIGGMLRWELIYSK